MNGQKYDFGGSNIFENVPWILGLICSVASIVLFFNFKSSYLQILLLPLVLLSANLFIGSIVARNFTSEDNTTLPFVDLFSSDQDLILDAGCGSGRTTVELSKVAKNGKIVALDIFDPNADEISSRNLLEENIKIANISEIVKIVEGDVTDLQFQDNTFDAVTCSLLLNNLGKSKLRGLKELYRVLKPKRKLLVVLPSLSLHTFAIMSMLSLMLTSNGTWRSLFEQAGFQLVDEGAINFGRFYLLEK